MVKTVEGAEVYENRIEALFYEYCQNEGIDLSKRNMDDNDAVGAWEYIYIILFKPDRNTIRYNNKRSKIDYADIWQINDILDTYLRLCFKFKILPLIDDFSTLTGISRETMYSWERGEYRGNVKTVSGSSEGISTPKHSDLLQKIRDATRKMTIKNLNGNPIGQQSIANNLDDAQLVFAQREAQARAAANITAAVSMQELTELRKQHLIAPEKPEI